jgi:hypothetical protein
MLQRQSTEDDIAPVRRSRSNIINDCISRWQLGSLFLRKKLIYGAAAFDLPEV